jgi:hypothetical protein
MEEEGRLKNFVDLARENAAMLVPALVAAILATSLFHAMAVTTNNRNNQSKTFTATRVGVFFTTLIDSGNIVSSLTLDRSSTAGKLQISGAFLHVIASFFWRLVAHGPWSKHDDYCPIFVSSAFVIIGEIIETVAVILTLSEKYFVPAVCLVSAAGMLGSIWFCVELGKASEESTGTADEHHKVLARLRRPVVWVGELLYSGTIAIATVQDWRNIFLMFPEVPMDVLEHFIISYQSNNEAGTDGLPR